MKTKGFTLIELLVVIVIIGILAAIALPNYIKAKTKAKEAECKANIHTLQIAIERYAVDSGNNTYPPWLLGGDSEGWARWHFYKDTGVTISQALQNDATGTTYPDFCVDPLLYYCYIGDYPRNVFVDDPAIIREATYDPVSDMGDPRFGIRGSSMGNGLDDPMFYGRTDALEHPPIALMDFSLTINDAALPPGMMNTLSDPPQLHYMMGGRRNPSGGDPIKAWWPGEFFYRAGWTTQKNHEAFGIGIPGHPAYRTGPYTYMLGVYGAANTKGMDIIRLEPKYMNGADLFYRLPPPWNINSSIDGVTTIKLGVYVSGSILEGTAGDNASRGIPECYGGYGLKYLGEGESGTDPRPSWPYFSWNPASSGFEFAYGAPDGISDGVILTLTPEGAFKSESQGWWSTTF